MSKALKSFIFAAILSIVCSVLLTTAATGLRKYQQRNIRIDRHKNILQAAGLLEPTQTHEAEEIESLYNEKLQALFVDNSGQIVSPQKRSPGDLPLWLYAEDDEIKAYIIPIDTTGLWGEINGYLAFEADGETVRGFTVFKHSETPGLGGEIEKRWFQKNFVGKKVVNANGDFVSIGVAKGSVNKMVPKEKQDNYVDGISGATLTGKFLAAGLANVLKDYEPVAVQFRKNQIGKTNLAP